MYNNYLDTTPWSGKQTDNVERGDPNKSGFRSASWRKQSTAWRLVADMWESPLYIQAQETAYLDRFRNEPQEKYLVRLRNSVFRNKFRETVEGMAGQVFRTDPKPKDAPEALANLFPDINLSGDDLHTFLLNAFELYLRDGNGYFLVDATQPSAETAETINEGRTPTRKQRDGDRPYWGFFTASQLINYREETINGKDVWVQATLEEVVTKADGRYGESTVIRHRVIEPGRITILELSETTGEFVEVDSYTTGIEAFTLVPITKPGTPPPLTELALLNRLHYNKVSDYDDWCHTVCVPERIYHFDSKTDAEAMKLAEVGPGNARKMWGEHAKAYFNEVTGKGVELAAARNEQLAAEMASIGIGMFAPTESPAKSATEIIDTAGRRQSKLARYAREFENAVEKAFYVTAEYINGIQGAGSVDLEKTEETALKLRIDYDRLTFSLDQVRFLSELVDGGKLSLHTFLEMLMTAVDMPTDVSVEDELGRIKSDSSLDRTILTEAAGAGR